MPKRILLECFNLALPRGTGIKTYATTLARVARGLGHDVEALLQTNTRLNTRDKILAEIAFFEGVARSTWKDKYLRQPLETLIGKPFGLDPTKLPRAGVVLQDGGLPAADAFSEIWAVHRLSLAARAHFRRYGQLAKVNAPRKPDIFHATHLIPVRVAGAANVYTIHDVIPLRLPRATLDNKKYFLNALRAVCRTADHIVTVSECSKKDILSIVDIPEGKVSVTYQSVSMPPSVLERTQDQVETIIGNNFGLMRGGYMLYFGALEPKKNVSRLIDAYAASGVDVPLIIAGGLGWSYESEVEQIKDERFSSWKIDRDRVHLERKVRRLDHLSFSHLTALIQGARAVLFPSLYEGFGLPVLEAMMLGAPVMTSNVSSLPEVAGNAAYMIDPYDVDAMARAIRTLHADTDMRAELSALGKVQAQKFSLDKYRSAMQTLYGSL